jgi:hypothetical protein
MQGRVIGVTVYSYSGKSVLVHNDHVGATHVAFVPLSLT